jgi:hypothetical protein
MTWTFEITAMLRFWFTAAAEIAALSPARPDPIIIMSYEIVSVREL